METFIYKIIPYRAGMIDNMTKEEEAVMDSHFDYLKANTEKGKVILAGPCLDGAFGIVILRADSIQEAEEFMNNDPSVKNHVMGAEVHKFKISLMEGA